MAKRNLPEWYNELEDDAAAEINRLPHRKTKKHWQNIRMERLIELDARENFSFSYHASRFEGTWLLSSLGTFYANRWIEDVLRIVKVGKEANVYLCRGTPAADSELVAAKVYRPRELRSLKKDHLYREGRTELDIEGNQIINSGMMHAIRKKSQYGQELSHTSWIGHEFATLKLLFEAGADVPQPFASEANSILMTYIGEDGLPGQPLSDINLEPEEVEPLFERCIHNIEVMLANQRVHGDLSAYNILYWDGTITLIDFPQAIHPEENRSAFQIFKRDVTRVCEYFARQKPGGWVGGRKNVDPHHPQELAADIWTAYRYRILPQVDPALLDAEDDEDAAYWRQRQDE
jgi:RIO kinase 1